MRKISVVAALAAATTLSLAIPVAGASAGGPPVDLSRADDCNFIAAQEGSMCLLPFPDDYYTVRDRSTRTGRRVDLHTTAMPQNVGGTPIDAAPYNLNDGFSPGQSITLRVPGLDTPEALAQTDPVGLDQLGEYRDKKAPVVVIDAKTGERWPIWVEIDSNASVPEKTAVLIHPAENFHQKHRYIVAMRNLRNAAGEKLGAPNGFRYYRDEIASDEPAINAQRERFERIFDELGEAGIKRKSLYLAWDFTVASDKNIAERMLHIRDRAFAGLGDRNLRDRKVRGAAPAFEVDTVTEFATCGADDCQAGEDREIQRRVDGTFTVPCYLQPDCGPGGDFDLADGLPQRNGTWTANFHCIIPRENLDQPGAIDAGRAQIYGHGLLGAATEAVTSSAQQTLAQRHQFVICATDEIGFSSADVPNVVLILQDLSRFTQLTDRVQQGLLNELFLGRLMIHSDGFVSHPAFHTDGSSLGSPQTIDLGKKLFYNGNSQGGILGGALTAVAPDFNRASLGVPAMNYSVLLNRSVDFDLYASIGLYPNYPDELAQPLALSLIQMLWDRSDANGYAHRMTANPLPNTPPHQVLMNVAFGDHQVTTWQADVEARTIGARKHVPVVYPGRWPGVDPLWDIPKIKAYPYKGSAIVYWDSGPTRPDPDDPMELIGNDPPPLTNVPNRSGEDPHGDPRQALAEQIMVSRFLRPNKNSKIFDTCEGAPCFAGDFTGP